MTAPPPLRASLVAVLPTFVLARLLVAAGWVVATLVVDSLHHRGALPVDLDLFAWDGSFYREIAERGYAGAPAEAIRFFPLFPLLGRLVALPLLGNESLALILVANVAALVTGVLVHRLLLAEGFDDATAARGVWALALFPSAFVLTWTYSEPLLLLTSIGCFLMLRERRWLPAGALGLLAALSRPVGLLLVLPAAIEAWRAHRDRGWRAAGARDVIASAAAIAGPALGAFAFLWWSETSGPGFWSPVSEQQGLRGDTVDPLRRLVDGVGELFGADAMTDGLHVLFAAGLLVLLALCARRLPASYTAYAAVVLVAALGAENLNSLERYGLNAFPLVLALGIACSQPVVERLAIGACAGGVLALSTLAWLGAYVP